MPGVPLSEGTQAGFRHPALRVDPGGDKFLGPAFLESGSPIGVHLPALPRLDYLDVRGLQLLAVSRTYRVDQSPLLGGISHHSRRRSCVGCVRSVQTHLLLGTGAECMASLSCGTLTVRCRATGSWLLRSGSESPGRDRAMHAHGIHFYEKYAGVVRRMGRGGHVRTPNDHECRARPCADVDPRGHHASRTQDRNPAGRRLAGEATSPGLPPPGRRHCRVVVQHCLLLRTVLK